MARAKGKDDPLKNALAFERPVRELDLRIDELRAAIAHPPAPAPAKGKAKAPVSPADPAREMAELEQRRETMLAELSSNLTVWQRIQLSRHIERPGTTDYVEMLFTDVVELHGDRLFSDDKA